MIILEVTSDWWGTGGDSHELPSSTIAAALADSVLQGITILCNASLAARWRRVRFNQNWHSLQYRQVITHTINVKDYKCTLGGAAAQGKN